MTREQRKQRRREVVLDVLIIIGILICIVQCVLTARQIRASKDAVAEADRVIAASRVVAEAATIVCSAEPEPEPTPDINEDELVERALLASGYLSDDVPLSYELQDALRSACYEYNIPYALALAVIEQETRFQMIDGDGGDSLGFFQIQPRWWKWLADELGADLDDPAGNIRTGCAILRHLLDLTGGNPQKALGKYNTRPGYPDEVIARWERWVEVVVNEGAR